MRIRASKNIQVNIMVPGVRVLRFRHADIRGLMPDDIEMEETLIFREILALALYDLRRYGVLVISLQDLPLFGSAFYRCLLKIRQFVHHRGARLMLCDLSDDHREIFALFHGHRVFRIVQTEADAVRGSAILDLV